MKVDYYQKHERHERHREYCRARWKNANARIRQRGFEPPYPPCGRPLPEMPSFAVRITLAFFNLLVLRYGGPLSFPVSCILRYAVSFWNMAVGLCAVLHIVNYIKRKTYKRDHANKVIPPLEKPVVAPPPEIPSDDSDTMNKIEVEFDAIYEEPADQAEKLAGGLDKHTSETEIQSMNEVVIDPAGDVTIVVSPSEKAPAYAPGAGTTATSQPQRFRVSSHKLIAASKFFETLLTIPGSEGEGLRVDGTTVLRISDTDPSMFTILLVLLCSPPCEVAQPMDLESITLLAVQACYFQCEKVLQHPSAQRSLHRLLEPLYKNTMDPRGLFVAWMYRNAEKFKEVTYFHLCHGQGDLETRQLPFSKIIVFTINNYRRGAIFRIMRVLCSRVHKLQDNTLCCYMCDSFQLGVLVRELDTLRLCPACIQGEDLPYQTHSIDQLLQFLGRLKNQPCIRRDANGALFNPSGVCAAHWNPSEIEDLLSQERSNLKGLEQEWFEGSYAW